MLNETGLLDVYRKLLLIRLAEERITEEYHLNEMKTPVHLGIGGEAIGVGVLQNMPKGTKVFGTYRNHAIYLALSGDTDGFFGEIYGRANGCAVGKAGSMHLSIPESGLIMTSAVVGTTIPVAVGAALAQQYLGKQEPVVVFFGDGAVEEGAFWESVNFACLKRLNILFVCEDNDLAIHTSKKDRRGFPSLDKVISGYDCDVFSGDGKNVEKVMEATDGILEKMKSHGRPGFLHLEYHRMVQHVGPGSDYDVGYRARPVNFHTELDPVINFERVLKERGITTSAMADIRIQVQERITASVAKAKACAFAGPGELFTHVFAE